MKCLNFYLTILFFFTSAILFAQTPQRIEADLIRSFEKIDYWEGQRTKDTTMAWSDSLEMANDKFAKKLQNIAVKFPFTISQKFERLSKEDIAVLTSGDDNLRIYSWDTLTGGTMHNFENVLQYRSGQKTYAMLDTTSQDTYAFSYYKLHTITIGGRNFYLAIYIGIFSTKNLSEGIRMFSIDNGKLTDAKLIRTPSGLHSKLYYSYDAFSSEESTNTHIVYDPVAKTISLPVVIKGGKVTGKRIIYKLTGQYFERVKN